MSIYECEYANLLKTSTSLQEVVYRTPIAKPKYRKNSHLHQGTLLKKIQEEQLHGIVVADVFVPRWDRKLRKYFSVFQPIFKNTLLSYDDYSKATKETLEILPSELRPFRRPTRNLIQSYWGEKVVLLTDQLKWLVDHGLVCTRIHKIIEYDEGAPFEEIGKRIAKLRTDACRNPALKSLAECLKLLGNCTCFFFSFLFTFLFDSYFQPITEKQMKMLKIILTFAFNRLNKLKNPLILHFLTHQSR